MRPPRSKIRPPARTDALSKCSSFCLFLGCCGFAGVFEETTQRRFFELNMIERSFIMKVKFLMRHSK